MEEGKKVTGKEVGKWKSERKEQSGKMGSGREALKKMERKAEER